MRRSKSSTRWLQEHFADHYVKKAQIDGYRSRAVYKLEEIDAKEHVFKAGMTVVDLGAAPGGWAQLVSKKMRALGGVHASRIIAVDVLPMDALPGVECVQGDFTEEAVFQTIQAMLTDRSVDLVLSDMAPNMSGNAEIDMPRAMYLAELAVDFSYKMLKPGGTLVMKMFHGAGFDALVKEIRERFKQVSIRKPKASRPRSRETYLLAKGYIL